MNHLSHRPTLGRTLLMTSLLLGLTACGSPRGLFGTVGPDYKMPALKMPGSWNRDKADEASKMDTEPVAQPVPIERFWASFNDPILLQLIDAVQQANPDIYTSRLRIEEARAALTAVTAVELPDLNLNASASRAKVAFFGPATLREQTEIGLRSNWEIDLFGGVARQSQAAMARLQGSEMQWHDARVSVAANTASAYFGYRQCEAQERLLQDEVQSRQRTAQALRAAADAGLKPAATALQEEAALAEFERLLRQKRTNCNAQIKALVALSQTDEQKIRDILATQPQLTGKLPVPPQLKVDSVPADVLMRRPDVRAAERQLAAAAADVGAFESRLYPSLTLTGTVAPTRIRFGDNPVTETTTWSIGPSFNLPIFNRGRLKADVAAAQARYDSLQAQFRGKAFDAVREVEQSLLKVSSTADEATSADAAVDRYRQQLGMEDSKYQTGLSSAVDLELNRRVLLRSQMNRLDTQLDRLNAWINLHRALGGHWTTDSPQAGSTPSPQS